MEFNLLLVIFLLVLAAEAYSGVKKGMVKKLVSLIAFVVMIVMTALIVYGLNSYRNGRVFGVLGCIIVLSIIAAVYFVVKLVLLPMKIFSKLPIVSSVDKLLGIVFGVCEGVCMLWLLYIVVALFDLGSIEEPIRTMTDSSGILSWFANNNFLAGFLAGKI